MQLSELTALLAGCYRSAVLALGWFGCGIGRPEWVSQAPGRGFSVPSTQWCTATFISAFASWLLNLASCHDLNFPRRARYLYV